MITLALHHDESVFVYLNETSTNKKNIKQLGYISSDLNFDRSFFFRKDATDQIGKLLGEILAQLKIPGDDIAISFPADLVHLSGYDEVPENEVQPLIDSDLWLNTLKFGKDFIEQSDCQVKLVHKKDDRAFLNAVYFPRVLYDIFSGACRQNHCTLAGIGINLFNLSEVVRQITDTQHNFVCFLEEEQCELLHMDGDLPVGYARFVCTPGPLVFFARQGAVPLELCEMIAGAREADSGKYPLYAACSVPAIGHLHKLKQRIPALRIVDPLPINTVYSKPEAEFDKKYNTVFASALGALL